MIYHSIITASHILIRAKGKFSTTFSQTLVAYNRMNIYTRGAFPMLYSRLMYSYIITRLGLTLHRIHLFVGSTPRLTPSLDISP